MTTYYAAQLLIALSVVDSHEDKEMNFCVIQETDIIKIIQEHGKVLSQVHRDDLFALLSAKRTLIQQTMASTSIISLLLEKKVQLEHNIDLLLNRTPVMLLIRRDRRRRTISNDHDVHGTTMMTNDRNLMQPMKLDHSD
jgi:hypothetical protein